MSEDAERKPKTIRIPGPGRITIEPAHQLVVTVSGRVVVDTRAALTVREVSYPPVPHIPRKDVDTALLARSNYATYRPYKGDCTYYGIPYYGIPYYGIPSGASVRSTPSGRMRRPMPRSPR